MRTFGPHNIIQTSSVSETTPVPYLVRAIVCTPFCRGLSHNALQKQPVSVLYFSSCILMQFTQVVHSSQLCEVGGEQERSVWWNTHPWFKG